MIKNVIPFMFTHQSYLLISISGFVLLHLLWIGYPHHNFQHVIAQFPVANHTDTQNNSLFYEDKNTGIKVGYPSSWEQIKGNSSENVVVFRAKLNDSSDGFRPGVGVYVQHMNYSGVPLDDYNDMQIASLNNSFNLVSNGSTIFADRPAHKAVYDDSSKRITGLQIWTINNNLGYTIIYLASSKQYPSYLPYAERIINSFEIIPIGLNLSKLDR